MNIFVLDKDPVLAATYHIDRHCNKMILESAQMLSVAVRLNNPGDHPLYRITHKNHPCTLKCRNSRATYEWVLSLMKALASEFEYRFEKSHASAKLIPYLEKMTCTIPEGVLEYVQTMPDEYKNPCIVTAYRKFYRERKMFDKNGKFMGIWTKRGEPEWLKTTKK